MNDEELTPEEMQEALDAKEQHADLKFRVEHIVASLVGVLTHTRASNTEALSAAYTLATRLTTSTIAVYPKAGAEMRPLAIQLLMATADPKPVDAEVTPVAPTGVIQ